MRTRERESSLVIPVLFVIAVLGFEMYFFWPFGS